ncbi:bifunctional DNA-formamidopyrimidine glycosylase/DNA-(apurinic or apyrimidinic site) lyase [Litorivicinus lipolyticus]|uniref:Formamidopyrimidine-DNA glycosylase n=1 Tax=Litorivicinus lipolyticus TaxID=418701 RepID=A0A5Q2QB69_9GAMM|nr:bifunctional DNA-formamidopyrimidine glycosylase/DNA-(apurinic or apyrimidinic site) lyase [Litorivicinus lipolyticus]QGG79217.1 bifunctional DNA-formamidopyrimidine glycosylase/DNA-(apurinic or apyrimidinic site) lyase [Litorivicinus lipolyticus]
MPELPEVETTTRGLAPHLTGQRVAEFQVRNPRLRWPVVADANAQLAGRVIERLHRRSKLMLIQMSGNLTALSHLGMSGSWRIADPSLTPKPHDHLLLSLENGVQARYHDPRRFGSFELCPTDQLDQHPRIRSLGPEPLTDAFDAARLYRLSRGRKAPVKAFVMDNQVVVGVGNIYATEALFAAGIHPKRAAGQVSQARYQRLVVEIKAVLARAIDSGGSTLRDFVNSDGQPGYFAQTLTTYGRAGRPCVGCATPLKSMVIGQRTSVWCPSCQR